MDATLPLYLVTTMDDAIDRSLAQDRFTTLILGVFATVSLLLAAVGIYGAFAAEVTAREKEIGVRLALGARGSRVLLLVLRRGLALAMIGAALGVGAGLLLSRSMAALMFGVPTSDPLSFAGVAALLLAVAVLATLVPAWRAARTSPLTAIRSD
jgi:ABC-type antimicrobial peptide transport system permease subunit